MRSGRYWPPSRITETPGVSSSSASRAELTDDRQPPARFQERQHLEARGARIQEYLLIVADQVRRQPADHRLASTLRWPLERNE